eukprot:tig00000093_g3616.t1
MCAAAPAPNGSASSSSAAVSVHTRIRHILQCPACAETLSDPRVLGCSCTLCAECLRRLARAGSRSCPSCRRPTLPLTLEQVEAVPPNLIAAAILEHGGIVEPPSVWRMMTDSLVDALPDEDAPAAQPQGRAGVAKASPAARASDGGSSCDGSGAGAAEERPRRKRARTALDESTLGREQVEAALLRPAPRPGGETLSEQQRRQELEAACLRRLVSLARRPPAPPTGPGPPPPSPASPPRAAPAPPPSPAPTPSPPSSNSSGRPRPACAPPAPLEPALRAALLEAAGALAEDAAARGARAAAALAVGSVAALENLVDAGVSEAVWAEAGAPAEALGVLSLAVGTPTEGEALERAAHALVHRHAASGDPFAASAPPASSASTPAARRRERPRGGGGRGRAAPPMASALARCPGAVPVLVALLRERSEEVRAAAGQVVAAVRRDGAGAAALDQFLPDVLLPSTCDYIL